MKEIWKDIKEYEGLYQISNMGRVKSLERIVVYKDGRSRPIIEKILKPIINNRGYICVGLSGADNAKIKTIHQLVAMAFLNHKSNGHKLVIDHIDHNKQNNNVENLQIITQRENASKDKFRHNYTSQYTGVSWHKRGKKWRSQIRINGKTIYLGLFVKEEEATKAYQAELLKII